MEIQKAQAKEQKGEEVSSFFETFGFLSSSSPIGLVITDINGIISSFNLAFQDLLGIRIEEYRNTNVCDLYANPADRQRLLDMLTASGSVRNFEVELKHKNGT